jgi:hypothetical protein
MDEFHEFKLFDKIRRKEFKKLTAEGLDNSIVSNPSLKYYSTYEDHFIDKKEDLKMHCEEHVRDMT